MHTYFLLFIEFLKIGLFAVGGGYATLPFLYFLAEKYPWFTTSELTNMIAVSNVTPGPIGINMATYVGFTTGGIIGSIIATTAIVIPSLFIVLTIQKIIKQFNGTPFICYIFNGLRPAACAMIAGVGLKLLYNSIFTAIPTKQMFQNPQNYIDFKGLILLAVLFIISLKMGKKPIKVLLLGAFLGIAIKYFL